MKLTILGTSSPLSYLTSEPHLYLNLATSTFVNPKHASLQFCLDRNKLRSAINLHTRYIYSTHLICEERSTNAINCNAGHATGRSFPAIKVSLTTYANNKVASKDIRASLDVLTSGC